MFFERIADCVFLWSVAWAWFSSIRALIIFISPLDPRKGLTTCHSTEKFSIELILGLCRNRVDDITVIFVWFSIWTLHLFICDHIILSPEIMAIATFGCTSPNTLEYWHHAEDFAWLILKLDFYEWCMLPVISDLSDWNKISWRVTTGLVGVINDQDS